MTAKHVVEDAAVRQVFLEDFLDFCQTSSTSQLLHTQNGQSTFTHQGYPENLAKGNLTDMPFVIFVAEGLSWHSGTKE